MREDRPDPIFIGMATKEQQSLALLYNQIEAAHVRIHKAEGIPFGINPYVSFEHYRHHVMLPVLYEMLQWSVFKSYPEKKTNLISRFDAEWNMYAMPKPKRRKKKTVTTVTA
jgi:hypothetical protein